jgi:hypothetical protein
MLKPSLLKIRQWVHILLWRVARGYGTMSLPQSSAQDRVFLEKLIVTQLVKNFSAFYGTQRFKAVFTTARRWSLS